MATKTTKSKDETTKMPFEGMFETMKESFNPEVFGTEMQEKIQANIKEFYAWQAENQKKIQEKLTAHNQEMMKQMQSNLEQSIKLSQETMQTQASLIKEYNKSMMDMMQKTFTIFK